MLVEIRLEKLFHWKHLQLTQSLWGSCKLLLQQEQCDQLLLHLEPVAVVPMLTTHCQMWKVTQILLKGPCCLWWNPFLQISSPTKNHYKSFLTCIFQKHLGRVALQNGKMDFVNLEFYLKSQFTQDFLNVNLK